MRKPSKKNKLWIGGIAFVLLIIILVLFSQANSIAETISNHNYNTVSSALNACNNDRNTARSQGQDCDPCKLACPSTVVKQQDGTYSYSYPTASNSVYGGTFNNLQCDPTVTASGALLEYKSFCNDNVRVCTKQDGTGYVTTQTRTDHGNVQTIKYRIYTVNCDTGAVINTVTNGFCPSGYNCDLTNYQLVCDNGYTADGSRLSSTPGNLGSCVSTTAQNDPTVTPLSGTFQNVQFDPQATPQEEVVLHAQFIPAVDGTYYVYGRIDTSSGTQPLAVVTGFASIDQCGNDLSSAGTFLKLHKGDNGIVEISIPAPKKEGTYNVIVGVRAGCNGADIDVKKGTVLVQSVAQQQQNVIHDTVTNDSSSADAQQQATSDKLSAIKSLQACDANTDLSINGCAVAQCIDSQVYLLSDAQIKASCSDTTTASTITTVKQDQATQATTPSTLARVTDWSTNTGKIFLVSVALLVLIIIGVLIFWRKKRGKK